MAKERKAQKKTTELDEARLRELIACKAHELFEQRGGSPGRDLDDWLEAERQVRQELGCLKRIRPALREPPPHLTIDTDAERSSRRERLAARGL